MSSKFLNQSRRRDAEELTREIDRATDTVVDAKQVVVEPMNRERAGQLGGKVLTYNPDLVNNHEDYNTERVREMAEVDNGYNEKDLSNPDEVGVESDLLVNERQEQSKENLLNELDPKRDHEAQIMAKDQMGVAREMVDIVERMIGKEDFRILDLEVALSKGRDRMLEAFENPRRLGDRN